MCLRLFLVGYESGNEAILRNIKKGVSLAQMRRFTQSCHDAGVTVHGTFILGLPGETQETIEETIRFAQELDVFSVQVSLAAPYPGTELYEQAHASGWLSGCTDLGAVRADGLQEAVLQYPGLPREAIFEAVDRFYRSYFLRPRPILRILKTMLEDQDVFMRRCREGLEFFKTLNQRKS